MMKDRLKNNIGLKVLAVFFAIFLWWTVVNVDNPVLSNTFNTEVVVTNTEVITNAGKSYQIVDNTRNVTVTVKARRKILDEIKASNIVATADLREMQDTSVPIRITIEGFEGKYEEATANPRNIQVKTENTQKKTFPITAVSTGTPRDGYVVGALETSPKTVDVSGPESSVGKISKVVAKVDVAEMSKNESLQTHLTYYDAADNIIDKNLLTSNCDKNGVSVNVTIWKTKTVNLSFDTSGIVPAEGFLLSKIEVEPQTVQVAASTDTLLMLSQINIGAEALQRIDIAANEEVIVDIAEYLPEGVILADSNASKVVVRIMIEEAGTKSILLPTRSINIVNLSDKLQVEYELQEIELKFSGTKETLEQLALAEDEIKANVTIDLTAHQKAGTYTVPIKITGLPEGCTHIDGTMVEVVLRKK